MMRIKKIKKLISLIVALIMIVTNVSYHTTFATEIDEYVVEKTIKVYGEIFNTASELELDTTFDARWIINNTESYNKDLSLFALLFSTDMYTDCYANVEADTSDKTLFLSDFGFEDVEYHNITTSTPGVDEKDTTNMSIGNKLINISGNEYRLIMVGFEGTIGEDNWVSNFDIGSDGTDYSDRTGDHPDWLNTNNHKGFDVVANRADNVISDYVDDIVDTPEVEKRYFFTGHSRGASIANIIGAKYIDNGEKALTYTFAAPTTTDVSQSVASSYKSIFNIINENDFVPKMPLANWGFRRYGNDIVINPAIDNTYKEMIESIKGSEYHYTNLSELIDTLSPMTDNRDDYYDINNPVYSRITEEAYTETEAEEMKTDILDTIVFLDVNNFLEINILPYVDPVALGSPNLLGNGVDIATESEIEEEEIKEKEETEEIVEEVKTESKIEETEEIETESESVEAEEIEENGIDDIEEEETESIIDEKEENEDNEIQDEKVEEENVDADSVIDIENECDDEVERSDEEEITDCIDEVEKEDVELEEDMRAFNGTCDIDVEGLSIREVIDIALEEREKLSNIELLGDGVDSYVLEIKTCPATMGKTIALILAHRNESAGILAQYLFGYAFISSEYSLNIFTSVIEKMQDNADALGDPHYIVSYYSIVKNYVPSNPEHGGGGSHGGGSSGSGGSPVLSASGQVLRPSGVIEPIKEEKCPEGITVWSPITRKYVGTTAIKYDATRDSFSYVNGQPCINQWIGIGDGDKNIDWYYSGANGQKVKGLIFINNYFYLFDMYGKMVTGTFVVDGRILYFNEEDGLKRGMLTVR